MTLVYDLILWCYKQIIWVATFFNDKAAKWWMGRKNWRNRLLEQLQLSRERNQTIWMHCASLGEFEQGRPLLEAFKETFPNRFIILSFFSPSGYEIRKSYKGADLVCYLPLDSRQNATDWVDIIQPHLAIFVKYEFWFHYLTVLNQKRVPTIMISAKFRSNQLFFKWYGGFYQKLLTKFNWIFVQDESSYKLLVSVGIGHCSVTGDTRIDRVGALAEKAPKYKEVADFVGMAPVFIAGSTWPLDEDILLPFINHNLPNDWKCIIAPHEIKAEKIIAIESKVDRKSIRYSQIDQLDQETILIIDNIGMLNALYQYGKVAYIGGGFGKAIHNTLEPMAFGLPVVFGPNYTSFVEAVEMVDQGGSFSVKSKEELELAFQQAISEYSSASQTVRNYILRNRGATNQVLDKIQQEKWI